MSDSSINPNKPHVFCSCYQLIDIDAMSSVACSTHAANWRMLISGNPGERLTCWDWAGLPPLALGCRTGLLKRTASRNSARDKLCLCITSSYTAKAFFSGQHRSVASACIRKGRCRRLLRLSMAFLLRRWPCWSACSHSKGGAGNALRPVNHSSKASCTEDKPTWASSSRWGLLAAWVCVNELLAVGMLWLAAVWLSTGCCMPFTLSCRCAICSLREYTCFLILSNASVIWGLSGHVLHSSSALMTYTEGTIKYN